MRQIGSSWYGYFDAINMIFSYFTDVSLISITFFVCCAYVVLVVNHLSEGLSQKKLNLLFSSGWIGIWNTRKWQHCVYLNSSWRVGDSKNLGKCKSHWRILQNKRRATEVRRCYIMFWHNTWLNISCGVAE